MLFVFLLILLIVNISLTLYSHYRITNLTEQLDSNKRELSDIKKSVLNIEDFDPSDLEYKISDLEIRTDELESEVEDIGRYSHYH